MTIHYLLPDLGEGLTTATIVQWLGGLREEISEAQPIVVVETLKAQVELPSPAHGVIVRLGADDGEVLGVGALLAEIAPTEG